LFARPLVAAFNDGERVLALGTSLLYLMALWQVLDAAGIIFRGALLGAGDTRFAAGITAVCGWVIMVPSAYVFAFVLKWGVLGAWCGPLLFIAVAGTLYFLRFRSGVWAEARL
ncbi:MAG TPA: MATE family efflux transporter, partial [Deinococcales bacterium]|nr:MATE family efflux transporter [Deinococcales bacterium]